jgi:hypothetical protein
MSDQGWDDDPYYGEDDDYEEGERQHYDEWVSLGYGVSLTLHTFPDGSAMVLWAIGQPGGGWRIGGLV